MRVFVWRKKQYDAGWQDVILVRDDIFFCLVSAIHRKRFEQVAAATCRPGCESLERWSWQWTKWEGNHHSGHTRWHTGVRFGAVAVQNWPARYILEQNSCHSGSPVCVALAVVLRCCASQLLLEDHQPWSFPWFCHPPQQSDLGLFLFIGGRWSRGGPVVLTRGGIPTSGSWRFGPSQRGQVEARSSLGQLGGQFEDDQWSSPWDRPHHSGRHPRWKWRWRHSSPPLQCCLCEGCRFHSSLLGRPCHGNSRRGGTTWWGGGLWTACSGLIRSRSESCSCDACGCPFPWLFILAGVAVSLTALATTGQLVQSPGSWAEGGFLSKTQQPTFAERWVAGCTRTSWSEIWISTPSTTSIHVDSRLWLTACLSSEGHSWPSTPPWWALCLKMGRPAHVVPPWAELPWSEPEPGRKDAPRSSWGTMGGLGLSSWRERLEAPFPVRLLSSWTPLPLPRSETHPSSWRAGFMPRWFDGGPRCSGARQLALTPCLFWTRLHPGQTAPAPPWMRCSGMTAVRGSASVSHFCVLWFDLMFRFQFVQKKKKKRIICSFSQSNLCLFFVVIQKLMEERSRKVFWKRKCCSSIPNLHWHDFMFSKSKVYMGVTSRACSCEESNKTQDDKMWSLWEDDNLFYLISDTSERMIVSSVKSHHTRDRSSQYNFDPVSVIHDGEFPYLIMKRTFFWSFR